MSRRNSLWTKDLLDRDQEFTTLENQKTVKRNLYSITNLCPAQVQVRPQWGGGEWREHWNERGLNTPQTAQSTFVCRSSQCTPNEIKSKRTTSTHRGAEKTARADREAGARHALTRRREGRLNPPQNLRNTKVVKEWVMLIDKGDVSLQTNERWEVAVITPPSSTKGNCKVLNNY